MNGKIGIIVLIFMLVLAMAPCECMEQEIQQTAGTAQITDMSGRQLTVPENISSVISTSPPSTILVYMLAPDKLAGWNFINDFNHTLMDEKYLNLPVIGGWFGTQTGNYETMINMSPDIVIEGYTTDSKVQEAIERRQEKFGSIRL